MKTKTSVTALFSLSGIYSLTLTLTSLSQWVLSQKGAVGAGTAWLAGHRLPFSTGNEQFSSQSRKAVRGVQGLEIRVTNLTRDGHGKNLTALKAHPTN